MFENWTFDDYVAQFDKDKSVRFIEPMSAHEINIYEYSPSVEEFAELKYDGHRGRIEFGDKARCFSRVPSKKSGGWFTENTDNVPHIREMAIESLRGTVIDGEFDYGNTSMGVQSVMGALPETAYAFQEVNGYIPFKAFDILYYKGINVQKMPLWKRKVYLALVVKELWEQHGEEGTWYVKYAEMHMTEATRHKFYGLVTSYVDNEDENNMDDLRIHYLIHSHIKVVTSYKDLFNDFLDLELEGIMLKTMFGIYEQKRSKNYLKVKGVSTWDCVVMGYTPPTKEYDGKELHKWKYWESQGKLMEFGGENEANRFSDKHLVDVTPVTKPYYMGWCGAIQFGVWREFDALSVDLWSNGGYDYRDYVEDLRREGLLLEKDGKTFQLVHVGDCKGLAEKNLELIRTKGDELIGTVLEVKANGIIDLEKGSLRHPRFKKWRTDKTSEMCLWDDHLRNLGGNK